MHTNRDLPMLGSNERGCGRRIKGGVYLETKLSNSGSGTPIEDFLVDPIIPLDQDAIEKIGLRPRRQAVVTVGGTTMIYDWIGEESYPNPADWIEEARQMGSSRRLELSAGEYAKIDRRNTKLVIVIPHAHIRTAEEYHGAILRASRVSLSSLFRGFFLEHGDHPPYFDFCPTRAGFVLPSPHIPEDGRLCVGHLWHRVTRGAEKIGEICEETTKTTEKIADVALRKLPNAIYYGTNAIRVPDHATMAGVVAMLPVTNLAIINDPDDPAVAKHKIDLTRGARLPVIVKNS